MGGVHRWSGHKPVSAALAGLPLARCHPFSYKHAKVALKPLPILHLRGYLNSRGLEGSIPAPLGWAMPNGLQVGLKNCCCLLFHYPLTPVQSCSVRPLPLLLVLPEMHRTLGVPANFH